MYKKDIQPENAWVYKPCIHPAHNPPTHMVYPAGTHTYVCPACGHITTFTVMRPLC